MLSRRSPNILNNALLIPIRNEHMIFHVDLMELQIILDALVTSQVEIEDYCLVITVILREDGVEGELEQVRLCEV